MDRLNICWEWLEYLTQYVGVSSLSSLMLNRTVVFMSYNTSGPNLSFLPHVLPAFSLIKNCNRVIRSGCSYFTKTILTWLPTEYMGFTSWFSEHFKIYLWNELISFTIVVFYMYQNSFKDFTISAPSDSGCILKLSARV